MGTWGTAIFADDDAADVRTDFSHYLADAQDLVQATDAIAYDFGASLDNPDAHTSFWLGLAVTQWRSGWLDPRARSAALSIISNGSDLAKWPAKSTQTRAKVLEIARQQLMTAPGPPKPMPKPWPVQLADLQIGEIIGLPLPSGRLAVMKVVVFRRTTNLKVRGPAVALQKWTSFEMPTPPQAGGLQELRWPIAPNGIQTFGHLVLTGPRNRPIDPARFLRPGVVGHVAEEETRRSYTCVSTWPPFTLDDIAEAGVSRWWDDPSLPADAYAPWHKAVR